MRVAAPESGDIDDTSGLCYLEVFNLAWLCSALLSTSSGGRALHDMLCCTIRDLHQSSIIPPFTFSQDSRHAIRITISSKYGVHLPRCIP